MSDIEPLDILSAEDQLFTAFSLLESFIVNTGRKGACHDTSAIFYILASELGFNPKLCIGEVREPSSGAYFDHSWVEIDGSIYDVAIAYPLPNGKKVSGPIFDSTDQETDEMTDIEFGIDTDSGLDEIALEVSEISLSDYETLTESGIWEISAWIGQELGLVLDEFFLDIRYGSVMREKI
ncbi:acetyltransferase [Pantoea ananatis]|uniref:acetyltransferase n=1 Tax=Pantoea ananas TaxID=553 RepID=UPI000E26DCF6|nr:acetyltransferase [Pantoea ananatis]REE77911.1 hypothetical protein C7424_0932 [Pantoea ananatis]BBL31229.1 hypothetical protein PAFU01_26770 [Pantoea ananatis]